MPLMSDRNKGTRVLVTGGAQGIGLAVATRLVEEGCKAVVLVGRSEEKGKKAVAEIEKLGAEALFVSADVSSPDDCARAFRTAWLSPWVAMMELISRMERWPVMAL